MNIWPHVGSETDQQTIMDWLFEQGGEGTTHEIAKLLGFNTKKQRAAHQTHPQTRARSPLDVLQKKGVIECTESRRGMNGYTKWRLVVEPLLVLNEEAVATCFTHHPFLQALAAQQIRIRELEARISALESEQGKETEQKVKEVLSEVLARVVVRGNDPST